MKEILLIIFLVILSSCGGENLPESEIKKDVSFLRHEYSNEVFDEFKDRFNDQSNIYYNNLDLSNININFDNLDKVEQEAKAAIFSEYSETSIKFAHDKDHHDHDNLEYTTKDGHNYEFLNKNSTKVGVCIKYSSGEREILIRESAWNTFSDRKKEILIFHELGHCALNREHDNTLRNDKKVSIMNSSLLNQDLYSYLEDSYLIELFQNSKDDIFFEIDQL